MATGFDTEISTAPDDPGAMAGPWRSPRNMLGEQTYDDHASIHDDETARTLGFRGGTVEGPTHFSQLSPLGSALWGRSWFEHGCVSAHYRNPCFEGERARAFAKSPPTGASITEAWMVKEDGTEILRGTLSVGPKHPVTALDMRLSALADPGALVILRDVSVGARSARRPVRMAADQHMGPLYPFSLRQKLQSITEPSSLYDPASAGESPWGRAIIPFEMISVLGQYTAGEDTFPVKGPVVGLFADQEIRLHGQPVFVDEPYEVEREVVALSGSRRTESLWVRTRLLEAGSERVVATLLLNQAYLKESYANYAVEAAAA